MPIMTFNSYGAIVLLVTVLINVGLAASGIQKTVSCEFADAAGQAAAAAAAWR